ncbi:glycosyltransferase family 2 protein [Caldinitratiruptor microaerophilus]|uniref:Glycosyl transferase n=1 Tax=Caldinitratiruptor microaerophilus TaxID=671077 RepID=A0AA35CL16_9FIRM|nr:glycosyltransferase family 2 protein [Caldinitratiruptor microaerophilus]BDG60373.1 glycosyl transferase [Caldinitratiruptor microaerophilus]
MLPFVSVIIPCRNEGSFIGNCLESILANDYPKDRLEVLVVDGMSSDDTRTIVSRYTGTSPKVVLLDNPRKVTPAALNIGIAAAQGDLILRMDAHAIYDKSYISRCVEASQHYAADNVGGIVISRPRKSTKMGEAISATFNHPFGAGNARYRTGMSEPVWVDTVFGGCYRREVFQRVGVFNEALVRNQDYEFNMRLKKVGGRTLAVPDAIAYYYIRSDLWSFMRQNWLNGVWVVLSLTYSNVFPISWRHVVPLGLVGSLVSTLAIGVFGGVWWPLLAVTSAYLAATILVSAQLAWSSGDPWKLVLMPVAFAALHLPYGFGSLWGVAKSTWCVAARKAKSPEINVHGNR